MNSEVKYMTLSEVVDAYLKKSRKVKKKPKATRVLRIWYYGKIKLAKRMKCKNNFWKWVEEMEAIDPTYKEYGPFELLKLYPKK